MKASRKLTLVAAVLYMICVARVSSAQFGRIEKPLVIVTNPPSVRMLVPGFAVRELPLQVNNINNLVFAPDGRLFALCYDGNVLQLKDTDNDGLEDAATHFYNNARGEILPSIGMCWGPGGLYIASQGRVLRLRDKRDGTGELETVTSGWPEPTGKAGSNLDAIGIAVNQAGEIFFGIGCDDWRDAYRVNKSTGKSEYDIHSERGTIQKISADWKTREVICTGVRFTVGLAFNSAGDLFATDQEGATWLPNGNPFDELLHIQPGRHFGFPPRHPKHLPAVIDEPSTFDYGPQHQSTCGLHFNDGRNMFGPEWWRGDAIVAGESRGKIWRTKLVKTVAGYVARTDLIACLKYLTIDAVPTPQGDLLIACHTGEPDWGTGPQGKGKLFKISYVDKTAPQPVLTFAASPTETVIVFDRELDAARLGDLTRHCEAVMGKHVTAGERFESFRPGYQAVKNQRTMPRYELPVMSIRPGFDRRSVVLQTAERTEAVNYAISMPSPALAKDALIDVQFDLTGVEATWRSKSGDTSYSAWLPHFDLNASHDFVTASASHLEFFKYIHKAGMLTLRGQLDLWQMLRSATQAGSKLDFDYPPESVTVVFESDMDLKLALGTTKVNTDRRVTRVTLQPREHRWLPIEVTFATGGGAPRLDMHWFTAEDSRPRPVPLHRVLLPWAKPYMASALVTARPEIDGGDWANGRKLFFGEQAACFKCHAIGGEGGTIGPDLSNLIFRDYASVMKDLNEPSAALNPDYLSYNVYLKDGDVQSGVIVKSDHEQVVLGQVNGQNLTIPKERVASMAASAISLMPEGLLKALNEQEQKDLMTFLLNVH